jgi:hypothetical protein
MWTVPLGWIPLNTFGFLVIRVAPYDLVKCTLDQANVKSDRNYRMTKTGGEGERVRGHLW